MRDYPRIRFADKNGVYEQVMHLRSEIDEFLDAYIAGMEGEAFIEAHDINQSAYTLMDILERMYPGQAWAAKEEMIAKNERRGYYDQGVF